MFDETIKNTNEDISITQPKISEYLVSSNSKLDNFNLLFKNNIVKYNDLIVNS